MKKLVYSLFGRYIADNIFWGLQKIGKIVPWIIIVFAKKKNWKIQRKKQKEQLFWKLKKKIMLKMK